MMARATVDIKQGSVRFVETTDALAERGSRQLVFVKADNTLWIHEYGSEEAAGESIVDSPTGRWHRIGGGGTSQIAVADAFHRIEVTATPADGAITIPFGFTIEEGWVDAVAVYRSGLRLVHEEEPLSSNGFRVNDALTGVVLGEAADGATLYVMLVPTGSSATFGSVDYVQVDAEDSVVLPDGADVVAVYLNGFRIQEASGEPGPLEWVVVDGTLIIGSPWEGDSLTIEYVTG